jgi:hypothetical protein
MTWTELEAVAAAITQIIEERINTPERAQAVQQELLNWQARWYPVTWSTSWCSSSSLPYTVTVPPMWPAESVKPELSKEEREGYREQFKNHQACIHCGCFHLRACPRVKRIVWRNKEEPSEVEFWPDSQWPKEYVVAPEDIWEDDEPSYDETHGLETGT